jgi:hypothetical protein
MAKQEQSFLNCRIAAAHRQQIKIALHKLVDPIKFLLAAALISGW